MITDIYVDVVTYICYLSYTPHCTCILLLWNYIFFLKVLFFFFKFISLDYGNFAFAEMSIH